MIHRCRFDDATGLPGEAREDWIGGSGHGGGG